MKIMRLGKTAKDRKSGAQARNATNKAARNEWRAACIDNDKANPPFPRLSCNGKKNRSRYTGKGGAQVVL